MTSGNTARLSSLSDRIFYATLILHTLILATLFAAFVYSSVLKERARSNAKTIEFFHNWEARITEQVFISEVVTSHLSAPSIPLITDFEKELASQGVDANVHLDNCNPTSKALTFPLSMGTKLLNHCLSISLSTPFLTTPVKIFFLSGLLTIMIFTLSWLMLRRRIQLQIISPLLKRIERESGEIAFANVAAQVAHDIRSPLQALLTLSETQKMAPEATAMQQAAISRIKNIADDLLKNRRNHDVVEHDNGSTPTELTLIAPLVKTICDEKQLTSRKNGAIAFVVSEAGNGFTTHIHPSHFQRIISNLINNAFEASKTDEPISVSIEPGEIVIADRGKGIPPDILDILNSDNPKSFGKGNGNGLGLSHAKEWLTKWKGEIHLTSKVGEGTTATIRLPNFASQNREGVTPKPSALSPSCVLIEDRDDKRIAWWIAKKQAGHFVSVFDSVNSFLRVSSETDISTPIILGENLKNCVVTLENAGFLSVRLSD